MIIKKGITHLVFVVFFATFLNGAGNETITSFNKAKKILKKDIYVDELQRGFYSNCRYDWSEYTFDSGKKRWKQVVDKESCGYTPRTKSKRANFIEYEHIVPAHAFGQYLPCWRDGGRKNCKKVSQKFKLMEADLYNLVPAIGELNADRSNFTFTELSGEERRYGDIDFEVDFKSRRVEPRDEVKGQIARTYFYFQRVYGLPISDKQMRLFRVWDKNDPINNEEIVIYDKIKMYQKNSFK